jgi:hypothetical protein
MLRDDRKHATSKMNLERSRLEGRMTALRNRMDAALRRQARRQDPRRVLGKEDGGLAGRGTAGEARSEWP